MAKIPVDECPAGPAMDAAVARVLGCKVKEYPPGEPARYYCGCGEDYPHGDSISVGLRRYSTDIAAAETLWDKLAKDHWVISVCYGPGRDGHNYASVQMQLDKFLAVDLMTRNPRDMDARAETKAHAISRAFLKANDIEFVEVPDGNE